VTGLAMHFCTSALNFVTSVMPVLTTCSVQYWYDIVWPPTSPPPMARTGWTLPATIEKITRSRLAPIDILSSFPRNCSFQLEPRCWIFPGRAAASACATALPPARSGRQEQRTFRFMMIGAASTGLKRHHLVTMHVYKGFRIKVCCNRRTSTVSGSSSKCGGSQSFQAKLIKLSNGVAQQNLSPIVLSTEPAGGEALSQREAPDRAA
jgi:hypothetical protein